MVAEVRNFEVLVVHGSTRLAPQTDSLAMPSRFVRWVRIRIPPGPNGLVGFALGAAGVRVIPYNANSWFVGNDEVIALDLDGQISSGAWQLQSYNLGTLDHTLYLSFGLDPVVTVTPSPGLAPINIVQ
jgi:hypothetical protein